MYFRNNAGKNSVFVLFVLIVCFNLSFRIEGIEVEEVINDENIAASGTIPAIIEPPSANNNAGADNNGPTYQANMFSNVLRYEQNNINLGDYISDENTSFFKKVKNALHRGFFYGISNIAASLVTFAVNRVGYLVLSQAYSQKANKSSVTLEQLYLEAQLIKAYEQQNNNLSSNENQYEEFQKSLRETKKIYSDHIIEYFKQNQKQKDTESKNKTLPTGVPSEGTVSKNNTTSLPTGIPSAA